MKVTIIPIVISALDIVTKGLVKGLRINGTGGDSPNYSITDIGQNTENSPGDCHSNSSGRPSANADAKNPQRIK